MNCTKEGYTEKDKKLGVKFMKKNKKTKEEQTLKEENLNDVSGGKTTTNEIIYNREIIGDFNVSGNNADYQQMLGFVDKLDSSGKLDYLKRK